jgi:outer membrane protein insertion porin family
LEIRINEGPQATIKNVIIEGNDKTNEHVIRRELRTLPGNKFSRSELIRSQREIAN